MAEPTRRSPLSQLRRAPYRTSSGLATFSNQPDAQCLRAGPTRTNRRLLRSSGAPSRWRHLSSSPPPTGPDAGWPSGQRRRRHDRLWGSLRVGGSGEHDRPRHVREVRHYPCRLHGRWAAPHHTFVPTWSGIVRRRSTPRTTPTTTRRPTRSPGCSRRDFYTCRGISNKARPWTQRTPNTCPPAYSTHRRHGILV